MEFLDGSMQTDLIELWKLQAGIQEARVSTGTEEIEKHIKELLERVKSFVTKYSPDSYTVSVGVPLGASVSFTWESKKRPGPRFLAEV